MKIRFKSNLYDAVIEGSNVELQSISETIIFEELADLIREDAENDFYSVEFAGQRLSSFLSEYIDTHLQFYIDAHKEEGQVIEHNLN